MYREHQERMVVKVVLEEAEHLASMGPTALRVQLERTVIQAHQERLVQSDFLENKAMLERTVHQETPELQEHLEHLEREDTQDQRDLLGPRYSMVDVTMMTCMHDKGVICFSC